MPHSFKHAHDVEVLAFVAARQDRAAVHVDRGHIGAQHAHQAARHIFVATTHHHHAIHPLALHAGLNAIADDFAAHQRILHAFGAHGHAVRNRGRTEHLRIAARFNDAFNGSISQLLQAGVARRDRAVAIGHADHRLAEIRLFVAHAVIHGAIRGAAFAFGDVGRAQLLWHGEDGDGFRCHDQILRLRTSGVHVKICSVKRSFHI